VGGGVVSLRAFAFSRYNIQMNTSQGRFFIYARKSTESEDRQVRSIGDQLAELHELASKEHLHVVAEFVESQTAKLPGRPVFDGMITRIEKGEAAGILAWHPDRLARNSIDGGRIIHLVDTGKIKELKFPTFWFDPTPQGKFMLAIAFGQSKYYVDNLSENIKRGQRRKLQEGIWPQWAPFGYINDRKTRGIVPDPERAPLVRQAFELYATGEYTLDRLTSTFNALGLTSREGKPLVRTQFHRLLQNPIYYGLIRYGGEIHEGKHEPLITKKLFDTAQQVLLGKSKPRERILKPYPYRGLFRCGECGGFITTETQKGLHYLRCTKKKGACSQPYVREDDIGPQIASVLAPVALPQVWIDEILTAVASESSERSIAQHQRRNSLQESVIRIQAKLQRLTAAYLEEALSLTEYREAKQQLLEEKTALQELIRELDQNGENRLEPLTRFVKALQEATLLASTENSVEKARFLKNNGSNLSIQDRRLRLQFHGPWKIVENHGRFAQSQRAAPPCGAASRGESDKIFTVAEEVRFELTEGGYPSPVFKTGAFGHSATPPGSNETLSAARKSVKSPGNPAVLPCRPFS
jgi:site-specific DNA recombinase